jgi:hypothetical protein
MILKHHQSPTMSTKKRSLCHIRRTQCTKEAMQLQSMLQHCLIRHTKIQRSSHQLRHLHVRENLSRDENLRFWLAYLEPSIGSSGYESPDTPSAKAVDGGTSLTVSQLDPYEAPDPRRVMMVTSAKTTPARNVAKPEASGYELPSAATAPVPAAVRAAEAPAAPPVDFLSLFDVLLSNANAASNAVDASAIVTRNWNSEFQVVILLCACNRSHTHIHTHTRDRVAQTILAMPDSKEKFILLRNLQLDFNYAATLYGQIIISELSLPPQSKTIKPVLVGGIAGGEKCVQACTRHTTLTLNAQVHRTGHSVQVCRRRRGAVPGRRECNEGRRARSQGTCCVLQHGHCRTARAIDDAARLSWVRACVCACVAGSTDAMHCLFADSVYRRCRCCLCRRPHSRTVLPTARAQCSKATRRSTS